jgi:hypothetical protein
MELAYGAQQTFELPRKAYLDGDSVSPPLFCTSKPHISNVDKPALGLVVGGGYRRADPDPSQRVFLAASGWVLEVDREQVSSGASAPFLR